MVTSSQHGDWTVMKKESLKDFPDGVVISLPAKGGTFEWVFYNGNMSGCIMVFIMKATYFSVSWDSLYPKAWTTKQYLV